MQRCSKTCGAVNSRYRSSSASGTFQHPAILQKIKFFCQYPRCAHARTWLYTRVPVYPTALHCAATSHETSKTQKHAENLPQDLTVSSNVTCEHQQQLYWWPLCQDDLQQLEGHVSELLCQSGSMHPGPDLLEQFAAVEVSKSNIMRPAGYFADSLAGSHPLQAAAAKALQHAADDTTAPMYRCFTLVVLLLKTVQQAVDQLLAAAQSGQAARCSVQHGDQNINTGSSRSINGEHTDVDVQETASPRAPPPHLKAASWVTVAGTLSVAPAHTAAATIKAAAAVHIAQEAMTLAAGASCRTVDGSAPSPDVENTTTSQAAAEDVPHASEAMATAVTALQVGLEAVDAALNSTLPVQSMTTGPVEVHLSHPHSTEGRDIGHASSSSGSSAPSTVQASSGATGCAVLRQLMLCRHLLASWLPPAAAQAALLASSVEHTRLNVTTTTSRPSAAAAGATPSVAAPMSGAQQQQQNVSQQQQQQHVSLQRQSTLPLKATTAGPPLSPHKAEITAAPGDADALEQSTPSRHTTRQLLHHALTTLATVSSGSAVSGMVCPVLLLTQQQAALLEPLLMKAGFQTCIPRPDNPAAAAAAASTNSKRQPGSTAADCSISRSCLISLESLAVAAQQVTPGNTANAGRLVEFAPGGDVLSSKDASGPDSRAVQHPVFPRVTQTQAGTVLLHTVLPLQVHPGPEGQLLLTGLVDATEEAWQLVHQHNAQQQQQQQQQEAHVTTCTTEQRQQAQMHALHQQQHQQHPQEQRHDREHPTPPCAVAADDSAGASVLSLPEGSGVCLLLLTPDVLQLLLHHPHLGVRQQVYLSGLLPLLDLQHQVLNHIFTLREQLAGELAAPGGYAQLVLQGSCLGGAGAAVDLVQRLLPFAREHATAEWEQLQQVASRQARADGRAGGHTSRNILEPWDVTQVTSRVTKQLTDLDWGRDLAPYFTLPGFLSRIDKLLHGVCKLRLVAADSKEGTAVLEQHNHPPQQQCPGKDSSAYGTLAVWKPQVLHYLVLLAHATPPQDSNCSTDKQQQQQQHGSLQLLGHVYVELVSGGFPCCSLLQLPSPLPSEGPQQHTVHKPPGNTPHLQATCEGTSTGSSTPMPHVGFRAGSVVLRVPVPAAQQPQGFGQQQGVSHLPKPKAPHKWRGSDKSKAQQQPEPLDHPLMIPGPEALQALMHELGHALSYLCPSRHLHSLVLQREMQQRNQTQPGARSSADVDEHTSPHENLGSGQWLLQRDVGVHGLCLLSGPPVGLDVRETSSHLFEHWVRHPTSLQLLSRHERLDVALPQHTALQATRLIAHAGGCSSMKLHNSLLEALTDLEMHSSMHRPSTNDPLAGKPSSRHAAAVAVRFQRARQEQQERAIPQHTALLDDVEAAATAGPVGGAKAAYVAARLFASAAWKHLGFDVAPVPSSPRDRPGLSVSTRPDSQPIRQRQYTGTSYSSPQSVTAGEWMADAFLSSGGFLPSHHAIMLLLGGSADVLKPVSPCSAAQREGQLDARVLVGSSSGQLVHDDVASQGFGWCPNLAHDVYQDIELT